MKNADFIMKKNMKFGFASIFAAVTFLASSAFATVTENTDYTIDNTTCTVSILTANGLQNLGEIDVTGCTSAPTYTLANDITLSSSVQNSDCSTNWDNTNAVLPVGAIFDGAGHTISGVCIVNGASEANTHLFNLNGSAQVKNLNFENVYLSNTDVSTSKKILRTAIFSMDIPESSTELESDRSLKFTGINLDKISVVSNGTASFTATLIDSVNAPTLFLENIKATNSSISVESNPSSSLTTSASLFYIHKIGGLVSFAKTVSIKNSSFQGALTSETYQSNVGGLIGQAENVDMDEVTFTGTVTHTKNMKFAGESSQSYIAGLIALIDDGSTGVVKNATVSATISASAASSSYTGAMTLGGIIGSSYDLSTLEIAHANFIGKLEASCYESGTAVGAIIGYHGATSALTLTDVHAKTSTNSATDELIHTTSTPPSGSGGVSSEIAGLIGSALVSSIDASNISVTGSLNISDGSSEAYIAGLIGQIGKSANIDGATFNGKITYDNPNGGANLYLAGAIARISQQSSLTSSLKNITVFGVGTPQILFDSYDKNTNWYSHSHYVGGILGHVGQTLTEFSNVNVIGDFNISIQPYSSSTEEYASIGGLAGNVLRGAESVSDISYTGTITATNNNTDKDGNLHVGGLFGIASGTFNIQNATVKNQNDKANEPLLVLTDKRGAVSAGGIVGRKSDGAFNIDNVTVSGTISQTQSDTARANIGGILGIWEPTTYNLTGSITNAKYTGRLEYTSTLNSTQSSFMGGIIGQAYTSANSIKLVLKDVQALSAEKSTSNKLISYSSGAKTSAHVAGGLIGTIRYISNLDISNSNVIGAMYGTASQYQDTLVLGGLIGRDQYNSKGTIKNSSFVGNVSYGGKLYNTYLKMSNIYNGTSSSAIKVQDSYSFDLNRKMTSAVYSNTYLDNVAIINFNNYTTTTATIYKNGSDPKNIYPAKGPNLAYTIPGFSYTSEDIEGYPTSLSTAAYTTYKIEWVSVENEETKDSTVAFTNSEGKIAYNVDGSAITESSITETHPAGESTTETVGIVKTTNSYPNGWEMDLSKVYASDYTYKFDSKIEALLEEGVHYSVSNCNIHILKKEALMYIGEIPLPSTCTSPVYLVEDDFNFGGENNENCVDNWDNRFTKFKGYLNGQNHSVSGICQKESVNDKNYLFSLTGEAVVASLNLSDIYLSTTYPQSAYNALFDVRSSDDYTKFTFTSMNIDNVSLNAEGESSHVGLLGSNADNRYFNIYGVIATNISIATNSTVSSGSYVGGFVGYVSTTNVGGSTLKATINSNAYYAGGVAGMIYSSKSDTTNISGNTFELNLNFNNSNYVGGLIGYASGGNNASINGNTINLDLNAPNASNIGGITGYGYQKITSLSGNTLIGKINSLGKTNAYVGGHFGYVDGDSVKIYGSKIYTPNKDSSEILIETDGYYVGGIMGSADVKFYSSGTQVSGSIIANKANRVGGFFGSTGSYSNKSEIYSSSYRGNINAPEAYMLGGMAAYISGKEIALAADTVFATLTTTKGQYIGGVIADAYASSNQSYNTVIFNGSIKADGEASRYVGGIVGNASGKTEFSYVSAKAEDQKKSSYLIDVKSTNNNISYVGGIVGYNSSSTEGKSYKSVNVVGSINSEGYSYVGGISGQESGYAQIYTPSYSGKISVKATAQNQNHAIGGIFGYAYGIDNSTTSPYTIEGVTADGKTTLIEFNDAIENSASISSGNSYIGGLVGWSYSKVNVAAATISGDIISNNPYGNSSYVGGLFGYVNFSAQGNSSIYASYFNGSISVDNSKTTGSNKATAGGIAGYLSFSNGDLTMSGVYVNNAAKSPSSPFITMNSQNGQVFVGGAFGFVDGIKYPNITSLHAIGTLNLSGASTFNAIGGFAGQFNNTSAGATLTDYIYNGQINVSNTASNGTAFAGGFIGYRYQSGSAGETPISFYSSKVYSSDSLSTSPLIKVSNTTGSYDYSVNTGGFIGFSSGNNNVAITRSSSLGTINVTTPTASSSVNIAGLIGIGYSHSLKSTESYYLGGFNVSGSDNTNINAYTSSVNSADIRNSYVVDSYGAIKGIVNNNNQNYCEFAGVSGISKEKPDSTLLYSNNKPTLIFDSPKSPAYAHALGIYYTYSQDGEKYPYLTDGVEEHTHKISWVIGEDTLYTAYTDPSGKIAYNAKGESLSEEELPQESTIYYSTMPTDWEVDLDRVFTEDKVFIGPKNTMTHIVWMDGSTKVSEILVDSLGTAYSPIGNKLNQRAMALLPKSLVSKTMVDDNIQMVVWANSRILESYNKNDAILWDENKIAKYNKYKEVVFVLDTVTFAQPKFYDYDGNELTHDPETAHYFNKSFTVTDSLMPKFLVVSTNDESVLYTGWSVKAENMQQSYSTHAITDSFLMEVASLKYGAPKEFTYRAFVGDWTTYSFGFVNNFANEITVSGIIRDFGYNYSTKIAANASSYMPLMDSIRIKTGVPYLVEIAKKDENQNMQYDVQQMLSDNVLPPLNENTQSIYVVAASGNIATDTELGNVSISAKLASGAIFNKELSGGESIDTTLVQKLVVTSKDPVVVSQYYLDFDLLKTATKTDILNPGDTLDFATYYVGMTISPYTVSKIEIDSNTINTNYGPILKYADYPTSYVYLEQKAYDNTFNADKTVIFPNLASTSACFEGWTLTDKNGNDLALETSTKYDNNYVWQPSADFHGDVTATPKFVAGDCSRAIKLKVHFTQQDFYYNSTNLVQWKISYNGHELPQVTNDAEEVYVKVPNTNGFKYDITITPLVNTKDMASITYDVILAGISTTQGNEGFGFTFVDMTKSISLGSDVDELYAVAVPDSTAWRDLDNNLICKTYDIQGRYVIVETDTSYTVYSDEYDENKYEDAPLPGAYFISNNSAYYFEDSQKNYVWNGNTESLPNDDVSLLYKPKKIDMPNGFEFFAINGETVKAADSFDKAFTNAKSFKPYVDSTLPSFVAKFANDERYSRTNYWYLVYENELYAPINQSDINPQPNSDYMVSSADDVFKGIVEMKYRAATNRIELSGDQSVELYVNMGAQSVNGITTHKQSVEEQEDKTILEDYTTTISAQNMETLDFTGYIYDKSVEFNVAAGAYIPKIDSLFFTATEENVNDTLIVTQTDEAGEDVVAFVKYGQVIRMPKAAVKADLSTAIDGTFSIAMDTKDAKGTVFQQTEAPSNYLYTQSVMLPNLGSLENCFTGYEVMDSNYNIDFFADIKKNSDGNYVWNPEYTSGEVIVHAKFDNDCTPDINKVKVTLDTNTTLEVSHFGNTLKLVDNNILVPGNGAWPISVAFNVADTTVTLDSIRFNGKKIKSRDTIVVAGNGVMVAYTTIEEVVIPEDTTVVDTIPKDTIPKDTVPKDTVSKDTIPTDTIPKDTIVVDTIPTDTIPKDTIPTDTVPKDTIPTDTIPKDTVPKDTTPAHIDVFKIADARVLLSGTAMRFAITTADFDAVKPVKLSVKVYAADTLFLDTVITDSAKNGKYNFDYYPLPAGTYKAKAILIGANNKAITATSNTWKITEATSIVEAGTWNMKSLANVTKDFKIPEDGEGAVYYWDEASAFGDYMQYRKLKSVEDIDPTLGYWYINENAVEIKREKVTATDKKLVWDLKNSFSGWNMVANPYSWNLHIDSTDFSDPNDTTTVFWRWNAKKMSYEPADTIAAFEGLWVHTNKDAVVELESKPAFPAAKSTKAAKKETSSKSSANAWSLRLELSGENGLTDSWNVVGVGNKEIYVDEPPAAMEGGVSLSIENGSRALAKSIKRNIAEASWTLNLSAATLQNGYLTVNGLDELSSAGLYAALMMDDTVIPLNAGESVPVSLSTVTKTAVLKVSASPAVQLAMGISGLHFKSSGNQLMVNFNLSETTASQVEIQLLDASGHLVSSANDNATAGNHSVSLERPSVTGVFVLRVTAGRDGKQIKIKL